MSSMSCKSCLAVASALIMLSACGGEISRLSGLPEAPEVQGEWPRLVDTPSLPDQRLSPTRGAVVLASLREDAQGIAARSAAPKLAVAAPAVIQTRALAQQDAAANIGQATVDPSALARRAADITTRQSITAPVENAQALRARSANAPALSIGDVDAAQIAARKAQLRQGAVQPITNLALSSARPALASRAIPGTQLRSLDETRAQRLLAVRLGDPVSNPSALRSRLDARPSIASAAPKTSAAPTAQPRATTLGTGRKAALRAAEVGSVLGGRFQNLARSALRRAGKDASVLSAASAALSVRWPKTIPAPRRKPIL